MVRSLHAAFSCILLRSWNGGADPSHQTKTIKGLQSKGSMGKLTTDIFEVGQGEETLHDDALLVLLLLGRDGARGGLGRGSCLAARAGLPAFLLSTEVSGRPRILLILQLSRDLLVVAADQGQNKESVSVSSLTCNRQSKTLTLQGRSSSPHLRCHRRR